MVEGKENL